MRFRAFVCLLLLVAATTAEARPPHKRTLKKYYGDLLAESLHNCTACHLSREQAEAQKLEFDAEAPPHNVFGVRLSALGEELEKAGQPSELVPRLRQVAGEDADGDGAANELEILTGHAPGDKADVPSAAELASAKTRQADFITQAGTRFEWSALRPVLRPAMPSVADLSWGRNPIDLFVAAERERRKVAPRPEAPRGVLLRRVYLDLIGLPPTRAELQSFMSDESPQAYERVVDRLLASPQYGERWGRHWMDVWRYSDWAGWGQQIRDSQPHIWRWRDWIVESLNRDKPYDRMVLEMLAGDELAPGDPDSLRATGYLVRNYKRLSREQWMQDTVEHTAKAFLGITLACARCHDHMYDPISQQEYYQVRAVFEPYDVRLDRVPGEPNPDKDGLARIFDANPAAATHLFIRGDERRFDKDKTLAPAVLKSLGASELNVAPVTLPPDVYYPALQPVVQQALLAQADTQIAAAREALAKTREALVKAQQPAASADAAAPTAPATSAPPSLDKLAAVVDLAERTLAVSEAARADVEARIAADRAKYAQPADAEAGALAIRAGDAERRTALAKAEEKVAQIALKLVDLRAASNPIDPAKPPTEAATKAADAGEKELLQAKAAVDAARKATEQPATTYAALTPVYPTTSTGRRLAFARWIASAQNPLTARVAVNHLWLRHFGRGLVESVFDFGQNGTPPTHPALLDWLAAEFTAGGWAMKPLHRLIVTSSTYRQASTPDAAAAAIDPENRLLWRYGEHRMEAELVRDSVLYVAGQLNLTQGGPTIGHEQGLAVKRRSLYFQHAAEKQMTFLKLFDAAAVNECYQRKESIVPQQALALANSELTIVQGRLLARVLAAEFGPDESAFITAAFEQILTRQPTQLELEACQQFVAEQRQLFADHAQRLTATATDGTNGTRPSADASLRARENLVHAILNHNDFVTIR